MKRSRMLLVYLAALLTSCSRQSDATPLPRAEVTPAKDVAPEARINPIRPAVEVVEKRPPLSEALPSATGAPAQKPDQTEQPSDPSPLNDTGAKLLKQLLRPQDGGEPLFVEKPRRRPGPASLEKPTLPPQVVSIKPPRLPVKSSARPARPHPLSEGPPLHSRRTQPRLPVDVQFPGGSLVSAPAPHPDEPAPLPTLAQQQPDRAPVTDPTADFSTAAALEASIPLRSTASPFIRQNLPDPFEHKQAVRLRSMPAEEPTPAN